jgi:DNA-binding MarR family transcriptional regulator
MVTNESTPLDTVGQRSNEHSPAQSSPARSSVQSKYGKLFELMRYWEEYETHHAHEHISDLEQFSVWLNKRTSDAQRSTQHYSNSNYNNGTSTGNNGSSQTASPPFPPQAFSTATPLSASPSLASPSLTSSSPAERHAQAPYEHSLQGLNELQEAHFMDFHKVIAPNVQIAILLGRMSKFLTFYMKKIFSDSEIGSHTEFGILACVEELGTPKKIEVINFNLIEKTTGTEMMKRLVKIGMLEEFDDEEDKRSKRVRITPKGSAFLESIKLELMQAGLIVTGNMPLEKQQELANMLDYLNNFHNAIYFNQHDASLADIVENNVLTHPLMARFMQDATLQRFFVGNNSEPLANASEEQHKEA